MAVIDTRFARYQARNNADGVQFWPVRKWPRLTMSLRRVTDKTKLHKQPVRKNATEDPCRSVVSPVLTSAIYGKAGDISVQKPAVNKCNPDLYDTSVDSAFLHSTPELFLLSAPFCFKWLARIANATMIIEKRSKCCADLHTKFAEELSTLLRVILAVSD